MSDLRVVPTLTGLDTEAIIQELMNVERRPIALLTERQSLLSKQKQAWDEVRSSLEALASKIAPLTYSFNFYKKTVEVGDQSVLTATASTDAANASYEIKITSLARAQVIQSQAYADPAASLGLVGTISINGKDVVIAAEDSLNLLAQKINGTTGVGAQASVVQVAPGDYRLLITSSQTGTANKLSLGGDMALWQQLGFVDATGKVNEVVAAADAVFTINGVQFTRPTNVVSDAIPGVTLSLKTQADPVTGAGGTTLLTVSWDDSSLIQQVKDLIAAYNSFIDTARKYSGWDPATLKGGILFGDPLLQRLLAEIRRLIFQQVPGSVPGYESAVMVGISTGPLGAFSKEGKLSFDETKFLDKLKTNRDAVAYLFTSAEGIATSVSKGVSAYTKSDGYLEARMTRLTEEDRSISDRIEDLERRLDMRLATLRKQFTALQTMLAKMNSLGMWLAQQVTSMTQGTTTA
ncbi:MAG TPA: flagellar filament capping protein FliD [Firmicutes bacterium]|nr:flagellar filament capping protein FliD [Candidatus Fermentithermobacillaceae bacterium]